MKIQVKLFFILVPILALYIIPVHFLILSIADDQKHEIEEHVRDEVSNALDKVSRTMYERIGDVSLLSSVDNSLSDPDKKLEDKISFLRQYMATYKMYDSFSIYDKNGIKIGDTANVSIGSNDSDKAFFKEAIKGRNYHDSVPSNNISDYSSIGLHSPVIHISGPIYDENKNVNGVVVARFSLDRVYNIIESSIDADNSMVDLYSEKGILIYSDHNKKELLQKTVDESFLYRVLNDQVQSANDKENDELVIAAKEKGFLNYKGNNWILIVSIPKTEAFEKIDVLKNNSLLNAVLIGIGIFITIILLIRTVSNPLKRLTVIVNEIESGNLNPKIKIESGDEIGKLAKALNSMTVSLNRTIQLEKELAISKIYVKTEKLAAIGRLAGRLAHDIRNPISVIKNSSQLLRLESQSPNIVKHLDRIDRSLQRITHQIDDVLDFIRPSEMTKENILLDDVINSSVSRIIKPDNVQIILEKNHIILTCDPLKLETVFVNLILNAIEAFHEKEGTIKIRTREEQKKIVIEVEDSGSGVPQEIKKNLFEPLVTTKQKGTGLGLVSCKTIIEQHGGSISYLENPSTFVIVLPNANPSINTVKDNNSQEIKNVSES